MGHSSQNYLSLGITPSTPLHPNFFFAAWLSGDERELAGALATHGCWLSTIKFDTKEGSAPQVPAICHEVNSNQGSVCK